MNKEYNPNLLALGFVEGSYNLFEDYLDEIIPNSSDMNKLEEMTYEQTEKTINFAGMIC